MTNINEEPSGEIDKHIEGDDSRKDQESVFVRQQQGDNDYPRQIQMGQYDTGSEKQYE